jgi:hypothetical protein
VRLWVNGVLVINNWTLHSPTTDTSAAVALTAGQRVTIRMEYFENTGGATARLSWRLPGATASSVIPASQLFPATGPVAPTVGSGLTGQYFNNTSLTAPAVLSRVEAIDFNWGTGSPAAAVAVNAFSVRWSGQIQATTAGTYVFQTVADNGVRLRVNGVLLIDRWSNTAGTNTSGAVTLAAGQRVPITLEYFEQWGGASVRLLWAPPGSTAFVPVPAAQLYAN